MSMARAFVALGSNLGERDAMLALGRRELAALPETTLRAETTPEETAPLGGLDQPPYLNQMVLLDTQLAPTALLAACHRIERLAGGSGARRGPRARSTSTWCGTATCSATRRPWCCRIPDFAIACSGPARSRPWSPMADRPLTMPELATRKRDGVPIVMLTCYDALFARLLEGAGVDILLVGDSVNEVLAGRRSTLSATLDQMIYHAASVRRGAQRTPIVVDMPFLTYQVSIEDAIRNAGRVMAETDCHAV